MTRVGSQCNSQKNKPVCYLFNTL